MIERARLQQVVPVALSHAGWVAIELRRRLGPDRVAGVVLLDWMVLGPPPGFLYALAGLQDPAAWEQVRTMLFDSWTSGIEVPALHAYVGRMGRYHAPHWARAGREIASSFAAEPIPLDVLARLREPCQRCTSTPSPPTTPCWLRNGTTLLPTRGSLCIGWMHAATSRCSRYPSRWPR